MAYRHSDMPDVFMALESVLGADTGINGFAWQLSSVTAVGPNSSRTIYCIVNQLNNLTYAGKPFVSVIVTIVPGTPRHSAVVQVTGQANATLDGCMTSTAAAILASGLTETAVNPGALISTNS
jgi:hypothetical protein